MAKISDAELLKLDLTGMSDKKDRRGGTERGDSLVKEGWHTSNYSEENSDLSLKKSEGI